MDPKISRVAGSELGAWFGIRRRYRARPCFFHPVVSVVGPIWHAEHPGGQVFDRSNSVELERWMTTGAGPAFSTATTTCAVSPQELSGSLAGWSAWSTRWWVNRVIWVLVVEFTRRSHTSSEASSTSVRYVTSMRSEERSVGKERRTRRRAEAG